MKIFLAQQNYLIGNFDYNTQKIIVAIEAAKRQGGDLIVFSELAVCGYPPRDFLEFNDFVTQCNDAIETIKNATEGIAVLVGAPSRNIKPEGKDLFNSVYFIQNKEVKQVIHKTLLPNYDVFDEYRYFEPAFDWKCITIDGVKIAVTICEDIWDLTDDPLYRKCPMDILHQQQPQLMINLSASPYDYTHSEDRLAMVKRNVLRYKIPMIYCNTVGSQTEIVFDGGSVVFDAKGNLIKQLPFFEESIQEVNWYNNSFDEKILLPANDLPNNDLNPSTFQPELNIQSVYKALIMGIGQYFEKMGFTKAVIASSGGIDSAVTLALACDALGANNVQAVLMPSQYSTPHSVDDAVQLSKNLRNPYEIISIKNIYDSMELQLQPVFKDLPFNVAEENMQSRIRGNIAMAIANKFNYILLNTSNKSELATGYGTLYGDMAGGLGILGDVYKMQVYALANYINREKEIIPNHIITKAPSAELRPDQKDSDSLPEYSVLDAILYQYIEQRKGPDEIIALGFEEPLVRRIINMVNKNEYKRNQFCPIIRVSPKAFGIGRRMPIVAKYL